MDFFKNIYDFFLITFKGKKIAVLGERGTGKTRLLNFITEGKVTDNPQTAYPIKVPAAVSTIGNDTVVISNTLDVPGGPRSDTEWERVFKKADHVFYLFNAEKLLKDYSSTRKRIESDIRRMDEWLEGMGSDNFKITFIGTHCDLVDGFADSSDFHIGDFHDKFLSMDIFNFWNCKSKQWNNVKLVLGSLLDKKSIEYVISKAMVE